MHQPANTMGGRYGFIAIYADGETRTEFDFVWDELPIDRPIKILRLIDTAQNLVLFELSGFERYFFSNEALSGWSANPVIGGLGSLYLPAPEDNFELTAKIFGTFNRHQGAKEIRVDLTGTRPVVQERNYYVHECPFAPHACRPGVVT